MLLAGETVGVVGIGVGGRLDARVLVRVDALAEVYGVLELLPENALARVARHFQEEEARVALGEKVIGRIVFVHYL